jgi:hydrogenase small subunit
MANPSPSQDVMEELHVLWSTAGLRCDGETVALTAATQPSIEALVQGAIPRPLH